MKIASLDFETRSDLNLTQVGAEKYARHPSTKVLCASFSIDKGNMMQWRPWSGQEMPIPLKKALLTDSVEVHAWNAAFERQILKHVIKLPLPPSRFRCTQARARSMALPAKLEMCARALNMPIQKSDNRIMMKWCKPLPGGGYADDRDEYEELCKYCDVDVLTEQGIGDLLRLLTPEEQRDWEITEQVNDNGIPIDLQLIRAAQRYASDEMLEIRERLSELTNGIVTSPKQFQRIKDWLAPEVEVDSLDASVREELLDDPAIQDDIREVIQLVDDGGRASTAKFAAMENRADDAGRVHGAYIFNGAGQTGRFCVAAETLVETAKGPRAIAGLRPGDMVLTHKGRFRPVLNLFYKGQEEMYRLSFGGEAHVTCTASHRFMTPEGWQSLVSTGSVPGKMPSHPRNGFARALQNTSRNSRRFQTTRESYQRRSLQMHDGACFESTQQSIACSDLQTISATAISYTGANCETVWRETAQDIYCLANGNTAKNYARASTRQLFAVEERVFESAIRHNARKEISLAQGLCSGVEWEGVHATTSQDYGRSLGVEATTCVFGSAPYRREQNAQCVGQSRLSDETRAPIFASATLTEIKAVGDRGVWDIEVEEDHSYIAQGLIHHNSSTGAQLHNFIREKLDNTEDVVDAIMANKSKAALIEIAKFPKDYTGPINILTILSRLLRPSLVAPDGRGFVWGDWKAIEARVLPWLSLENSASQLLDLFTNNQDVYKHQASGMFGVPLEEVSDGQRQRGKVAILSLGYGGGANALIAMARKFGLIIDPDTAELYKRTWRQANPWAQRFWNALESAIYNAVRNPGMVFQAGRVSYMSTGAVLWCLLPCGRMLAYPFPKIETRGGRFGPTDQVTCIKGAWSPKKGMNYWPRMSLWGGLAAENCLAPETEVLTDKGWKRIIDVSLTDKVHDGISFVRHEGLLFKGVQSVISWGGLVLTPDHKVLLSDKWVAVSEADYGLATERFTREEVRALNDFEVRRSQKTQSRMVGSVRLWCESETSRHGDDQGSLAKLRMFAQRIATETKNTRHVATSSFLRLAFDAGSVSSSNSSVMEKLWWPRHPSMRAMAKIREFLGRYGPNLPTGANLGSALEQSGLLSRELRMAYATTTSTQHAQKSIDSNTERSNASLRGSGIERGEGGNVGISAGAQVAGSRFISQSGFQQSPVYDLMNAGPLHRFVVRGTDKKPVIVSNCTQGVAASLLRWAQRELADNGWIDCMIGHTHDENLLEVEDDEVAIAREVMEDIMVTGPKWAAGLPLAVDMMSSAVYGK